MMGNPDTFLGLICMPKKLRPKRTPDWWKVFFYNINFKLIIERWMVSTSEEGGDISLANI